ncbi:hypothetical protein T439DRAFT_325043 [Meredithblackwellia eburnea MCA 4105]
MEQLQHSLQSRLDDLHTKFGVPTSIPFRSPFRRLSEYESILADSPYLEVGAAAEWKHAESLEGPHRRRVNGMGGQTGFSRHFKTGVVLALAIGAGYLGARLGAASESRIPGDNRAHVVALAAQSSRCNPYDQLGILMVDRDISSNNRWAPLNAPPSCQPIDFNTQIWKLQGGEIKINADLEHLKNRTVVIFGDSVDRGHNEHFCNNFVRGKWEMIGTTHPWSPPYPKGRELPPEGYRDHLTGLRQWPNYDQSRPYLCHIESLNLQILSVFHYGFHPSDGWIENHAHHYPPAGVEDRFDSIVIPIMKKISETYNKSPIPDIVEFTPGFWDLLRDTIETNFQRDEAMRKGMNRDQAFHDYDTWGSMKEERHEWYQARMRETVKHIARTWSEGEGAYKAPRILWRTLHHIRQHEDIPYSRVEALDSIGRSVVQGLVAEGRASSSSSSSAKNWRNAAGDKAGGGGGIKWTELDEDESSLMGLGDRLRLNDWGALMKGQERHFADNLHPLPLPGSFLWGQMMMNQLKMLSEDQSEADLEL